MMRKSLILLPLLLALHACSKPEVILNDLSRDPDATEELKQWERLDVVKAPELEVEWTQAHKYMGRWITATGLIVRTYDSGKATFLNFDENWKGKFHSVIFAKAYQDFDPLPVEKYLNKHVAITGKVSEHRGAPQIVIERPEQIIVIKD